MNLSRVYYCCLILSGLFVIPHAMAACQWGAEGTNGYYKEDRLYTAPPKLVTVKDSCAGHAPICDGFIYCFNESGVPAISQVLCPTVKSGSAFICPSAQTCAADKVISIRRLKKIPSVAQAPVTPDGQGDGGAQPEQPSGR